MSFPRGGNGLDLKKINSDMTKTLDALINEKSADLAGMVSLLWPWDRKALAGTTNITYSTNTNLTSRFICGDVITINSGVTVTTMSGGVVFICNEFINNGTLTASGKGAAGGASVTDSSGAGTPGNAGVNAGQIDGIYIIGASAASGGGVTGYSTVSGAGGAAHSGAGGTAIFNAAGIAGVNDFIDNKIIRGLVDFFFAQTSLAGAGGGSGSALGSGATSGVGGPGGGYVAIFCGNFENNGYIYAKGIDGGNASGPGTGGAGGGGGGGGGVVFVECDHIVVEGTISADGGAAGIGYTGNITGRNGAIGGNGLKIIIERKAA